METQSAVDYFIEKLIAGGDLIKSVPTNTDKVSNGNDLTDLEVAGNKKRNLSRNPIQLNVSAEFVERPTELAFPVKLANKPRRSVGFSDVVTLVKYEDLTEESAPTKTYCGGRPCPLTEKTKFFRFRHFCRFLGKYFIYKCGCNIDDDDEDDDDDDVDDSDDMHEESKLPIDQPDVSDCDVESDKDSDDESDKDSDDESDKDSDDESDDTDDESDDTDDEYTENLMRILTTDIIVYPKYEIA